MATSDLISIIDLRSEEWTQAERLLQDAGVPIPLRDRLAWAQSRPAALHWLMTVRGADGDYTGAIAAEAQPSRALPGHWILRSERVGANVPPGMERQLFTALKQHAHRAGPILRVSVELFSPDAARRAELAAALKDCGFRRVPVRNYATTLRIDLERSEEDIFGSLSRRMRRDIQAAEREGLMVQTIGDPAYAERMNTLSRVTLARTGGNYHPTDWKPLIELSSSKPSLSRIIGLFRTDVSGPDALLAYAWGCNNGDHAHYDAAGSDRIPGMRVSLVYPLVWDLVRWSRSNGASWFDLGGVTPGHVDSEDPLGGISDFKRRFSEDMIEVGEEWEYEPRPLRSRLANTLSTVAASMLRSRSRA